MGELKRKNIIYKETHVIILLKYKGKTSRFNILLCLMSSNLNFLKYIAIKEYTIAFFLFNQYELKNQSNHLHFSAVIKNKIH